MHDGDPYAGSSDPRSAGNGSLMRNVPVALFHHDDTDDDITRLAAAQSAMTHHDRDCDHACALHARMVRAALHGDDPFAALEEALPDLPPDVAAEQEKVRAAELLVLQFPMWWFGMPAILKGWVDRVFARGFAYSPGRKYDTGLLAGRTALVSVTTGTSAATYAPDGIDGSLLDILWPLHNGVLRYCGFDVLEPFVAHRPGRVGDEVRGELLDAWRARLMAVETSPRLFFHPAGDYGPDERLLPGVVARSGFQHNPER